MRKDMTWKQRLEYFKDYYLFQTVCIMIAIAVGLLLIWHFLIRDNEVSLYVAVLNETLEAEKKESLQEELGRALGIESEKIIIDDAFLLENDGLSKLEIYMRNCQIDVLIAGQEDYESLCGFGFMKDLQQVFDETVMEIYEEQIVYAAGYLDREEISFEDYETGQGEIRAYGFGSSEMDHYGMIRNLQQNPVIGIAESTKHEALAVKCVTWLLEKE